MKDLSLSTTRNRDVSISTEQLGGSSSVTFPKPNRASSIIFFLLCTVLVFAPVAFGAVETWTFFVLSLIAFLIIIFWLFEGWQTGVLRYTFNVLQLPLIGLIIIGLVQLLPLRSVDVSGLLSVPAVSSISLDPYSTRLAVLQLCIYLIFFTAAMTFIENRKRQKIMVIFIIIFTAVMAFFGILQRFIGPSNSDVIEIYGFRPAPNSIPFASFANQHHFAAFMEMSIGLSLGLLYGRSVKYDKRFLLLVAVLIMGIALVLTSSRGGMLSLMGIIVFIIVINLLQKKPEGPDAPLSEPSSHYRMWLIIGSIALVLVLFGSVLILSGDEALSRGIGLNNPDDVSNGRIHFWSVALQIIRDNPIFGAGLNAFGTAFTRYDTWNGTYRVEQAHNDYLQIFADAGIFGFICALAFLYFLFKRGMEILNRTNDRFQRGVTLGALAGCAGILLHSFFDFPLRTPSNAFYFLILAALATTSIQHHSSRKKSKVSSKKESN